MKPDSSSRRCCGTTLATFSSGARRAKRLGAEAAFTFTKLLAMLVLLMAVTLPAVVKAQDFAYEVVNGTITITGYTGPGGDVTIPDSINGLPVTSIGKNAFRNVAGMTSVTIPNGVISIEFAAFGDCMSLTSVTIPGSVTSIGTIGSSPFPGCISLTAITVDVENSAYSSLDGVLFDKSRTTLIQCPQGKTGNYTIPGSVISIGRYGFWNCTSLASVTIPSSVTSMGYRAFLGCTRLTSAMIGSGVTTIEVEAFGGCTTLTSLTIGSGVTNIGRSAFAGCTGLASVTIPDSVTKIEGGAFYYCTSLTNVTISDSVTSIEGSAFSYCRSLTSVMIGSGLTSLGIEPFYGCTRLAAINVDAENSSFGSVDGVVFDKNWTTLIKFPEGKTGNYTIPTSVTSIGDHAFYECSSLTSVKISSSVISIGNKAFADCSSLTSIIIPADVTSLGDSAFSGCASLKGAYFDGNAPSVGGFIGSLLQGANSAIVYYLPGTTGWGRTFGGRPTALWTPQIQASDTSFGVRSNQFGFNISWSSGRVVVVEACTDLAQPVWTPVETNTLTDGSSYFSDPQWTNQPARFYRLRSP